MNQGYPQQPQQFPPSSYGAPPQGGPPQTNTLAYVSLGAGLVSFLSIGCCCIPFLGWGALVGMFLGGITAVVTGVIARRQADQLGHGRTESIAGIVLGSIWLTAAIVGVALMFAGCAGLGVLGALAPPPPGQGQGSAPYQVAPPPPPPPG